MYVLLKGDSLKDMTQWVYANIEIGLSSNLLRMDACTGPLGLIFDCTFTVNPFPTCRTEVLSPKQGFLDWYSLTEIMFLFIKKRLFFSDCVYSVCQTKQLL